MLNFTLKISLNRRINFNKYMEKSSNFSLKNNENYSINDEITQSQELAACDDDRTSNILLNLIFN